MESNNMEDKIPESIVKYRKETTDGSPVRTDFDTFLAELGDRHLQKRAKMMYLPTPNDETNYDLTEYGKRVYNKLNVFCKPVNWGKDQLYMVRGVDRTQLEEFICWYTPWIYYLKKGVRERKYKEKGIEITDKVKVKICESEKRPMPRIVPIDIAVRNIQDNTEDYGNKDTVLCLYISAVENIGNTDSYYAKTVETFLSNKTWVDERCFIYSERDIPWLAHIPTIDLLTGKVRQGTQRVSVAPTPTGSTQTYSAPKREYIPRSTEPGIQEISATGNTKRNEDGDLV